MRQKLAFTVGSVVPLKSLIATAALAARPAKAAWRSAGVFSGCPSASYRISPTMMPALRATDPLATAVTRTPARFGCSSDGSTDIPPMPSSRLGETFTVPVSGAGTLAFTAGALACGAGGLLAYSSILARKPAISALDNSPVYAGPDFATNLKGHLSGLPGARAAAI